MGLLCEEQMEAAKEEARRAVKRLLYWSAWKDSGLCWGVRGRSGDVADCAHRIRMAKCGGGSLLVLMVHHRRALCSGNIVWKSLIHSMQKRLTANFRHVTIIWLNWSHYLVVRSAVLKLKFLFVIFKSYKTIFDDGSVFSEAQNNCLPHVLEIISKSLLSASWLTSCDWKLRSRQQHKQGKRPSGGKKEQRLLEPMI